MIVFHSDACVCVHTSAVNGPGVLSILQGHSSVLRLYHVCITPVFVIYLLPLYMYGSLWCSFLCRFFNHVVYKYTNGSEMEDLVLNFQDYHHPCRYIEHIRLTAQPLHWMTC